MSRLLAHFEHQQGALVKLERASDKLSAWQAARKRAVLAGLRQVICERMSWHKGEIDKAEARGFAA